MTIIRRVVFAARPTVNTLFGSLSTPLTNTVDTMLGKSSEGVRTNLCWRSSWHRLHYTANKLNFTATVN